MQKLKEFLPPFLIRKLTGLFYGWRGNYKNWSEAKSRSTGYDQDLILEKVKASLLKVKNGEAICERDSVIFDKIEYSFPLLTSLLWIANVKGNKLNLIDFGGSLGSSYFQNKLFLNNVDLTWNIVEQEKFVICGQEHFENNQLHFYKSIEDCIENTKPDVLLCSSVLQYIESPYTLIVTSELKFVLVINIDLNLAPVAGAAVYLMVATSLNLKLKSATGNTIVKVGAPTSVVVGGVSTFEHDAVIDATNAKAAIDLNICFIIFCLLVFYLFANKSYYINCNK